MKKIQALISLGSNLGDRLNHLLKALILLEDKGINILQLSSLYETPSWGFDSTPFFNACALIQTRLTPDELVALFLDIEKTMGRFRKENSGYRAREIDLDLLFYEQKQIDLPHLTVPHPRLHLRNFVLVPLNEIAPHWEHPTLHLTVAQLYAQSPDPDLPKKNPFSHWAPPLFSTFPFIAIEGNIGVGKTTFAKQLQALYKTSFLQETFADNPFLESFYTDPKKYALAVETAFFNARIEQNQVFWKTNKPPIVADYTLQKSLIFAAENLTPSDFTAFKARYKDQMGGIKQPDLVVYLHTSLEALQRQIKKRGRPYEQKISTHYLQQIEAGYRALKETKLPFPVVSVGTENLDFLNEEQAFHKLLRRVFKASFL